MLSMVPGIQLLVSKYLLAMMSHEGRERLRHQSQGSLPMQDGMVSVQLLLCWDGFSQASSCALSESQEHAHRHPQGGPKAGRYSDVSGVRLTLAL